MLLFQSEEWIERWYQRNHFERGETITVQRAWELSKLWYGERLSLDYHGRSREQVAEIFGRVGLTSKFWDVIGGG
jgi:hypothetical protein